MTMAKKNLLIVDDDLDTLEFLQSYLGGHEFDVTIAEDGAQAESALLSQHFDLLLIDLRLESESGMDLARVLIGQNPMPVIMLSAVTDDLEKIVGLESVLSDYLEKPINPRFLLAKIRSTLRSSQVEQPLQSSSQVQSVYASDQHELSFGHFFMDEERRLLVDRDSGPIELTNTEYRLLELFIREANSVLSREDIVERLDLESSNNLLRNIDVLVLRLRRKIETRPSVPVYLQTRRNKGYVFCLD